MQEGTEAFHRGDWRAAYDAWTARIFELGAGELEQLGTAADLLGEYDVTVDALQRAYLAARRDGPEAFAVHCAVRLALLTAEHAQPALAAGWAARAERLADDLPDDAVERGWVVFMRMLRRLTAGAFAEAVVYADEAAAIGRRLHDADLEMMAMCSQGRLSLYAGRVRDGLALLDESMVRVIAGEATSPIIAGHVYCTAIEGCQELGDFDRVAQWTGALEQWCARQPGLLTFTGQCALHRGQLLRRRGAWSEALQEFESAEQRYRLVGALDAVGLTSYETGDILRLRGDLDAAEVTYLRAADHGFEPQPGRALLRLRSEPVAALAVIDQLLAEETGPVQRCRLLPSAVEALLACGETSRARAVSGELARAADSYGVTELAARAAYAQGTVEVASGDPAGGLPYLRKALRLWTGTDAPHERARTRLAMAQALLLLGDAEDARHELEVAAAAFDALGARPEATAAVTLLAPAAAPGGLTRREIEVLRLVATGRSNADIAAALVLSQKTVARHLSNIFGKLGVGSRAAATAYAFDQGVVQPHPG